LGKYWECDHFFSLKRIAKTYLPGCSISFEELPLSHASSNQPQIYKAAGGFPWRKCDVKHNTYLMFFCFFPSYEIILDLVNDVFSDTSPEKLAWKLKMMASNRVHFQVPLLVFGGL